MRWYFEALKKYFVLEGRATRSEYWYFVLFYAITLTLAVVIDLTTGHFSASLGLGWWSGAYVVLTLAPLISVSVRRLHDIGRSGWWLWIGLVPMAGGVVLAILALFDSQAGANEYGGDPKTRHQSKTRAGRVNVRAGPAPRGWTRSMLTVLGVAACSVLVVGSTKHWWAAHGERVVAEGKFNVEEGARSGQGIDESACVAEAVGRSKTIGDASMTASVANSLWLKGCLRTSRAERPFCEGAPAKREILANAMWVNGECSRHSMGANPYCGTLFQAVADYCSSADHEAKLSSVASTPVNVDAAAALPAARPLAVRSLDSTTVDALMRKSGLWTTLASVSPQIRISLDDSTNVAANSPALTEARAAALFAFSPERLRTSVGRELSKRMSAAEAAEALGWLDGDVGRRITSIETAGGAQADHAQSIRDGMHLLPSLSPERVGLLKRLVQVTRQGETSAAMATNIGVALAMSSAGALSGASASDREAFRHRAEEGQTALAKRLEQTGLATSALVYRRVGDDDLERYLAFLSSPAGQGYITASMGALDAAFSEAIDIMRRGTRGVPLKAST
jgi:uncharacterized membrane protein YhaH (DUF805 family)